LKPQLTPTQKEEGEAPPTQGESNNARRSLAIKVLNSARRS